MISRCDVRGGTGADSDGALDATEVHDALTVRASSTLASCALPLGAVRQMAGAWPSQDFKFGLYTDIGPKGCHHPFTGSYGYYAQDAATSQQWEVLVIPLL